MPSAAITNDAIIQTAYSAHCAERSREGRSGASAQTGVSPNDKVADWSLFPLMPGAMVSTTVQPRSRRITYMLVLVTAAELLLVVLGALIYWIEFAD